MASTKSGCCARDTAGRVRHATTRVSAWRTPGERNGRPMPLTAIDCHVHPWDATSLGFMGAGRMEAMSRYFGRPMDPVSFEELAERYRSRNMMAVLLATDDSTVSGLPP